MPDKYAEQKHFELLSNHLGFEKDWKVYRPDPPDFLVHHPEKIIGIEHTKLFLEKEYPLQAKESIEDDISNISEKYADKNGFIPARTQLLFGDIKGLNKSERRNVAHSVAEEVQLNLTSSSLKQFEQIRFIPQTREVRTVYATVMPDGFENHYFAVRAGWVKRDATEEVYTAIKKKSEKLASYKAKCDETWLLIVAEGRNPSSLLGKGEGVKIIPSLHGFARVFFMFYITKYVQEVIAN
jgi:hypothetical protein